MADEHIKVKLPQLPKYAGAVKNADMIYVWEDATGLLKHANVGQLPFSQGGGSGPLLGSPFKVRLDDSQVTISGGNTIVSDARLLGKTDYPVSSSQLNNAVFRDNELVYDPQNGSVTILGFVLQVSEVLVLYPDGVSSGGSDGGSLQPILDRLATLESMLAPFLPTQSGDNFGRIWWSGPISDIPPGWEIDTVWAGKIPFAYSGSDTEFNAIGKTGGSKNHKITIPQLPKHRFFIAHGAVGNVNNPLSDVDGANQQATTDAGSSGNVQYRMAKTTGEANRGRTNELGNDEAIPLLPPYRVGCWIKYVGV